MILVIGVVAAADQLFLDCDKVAERIDFRPTMRRKGHPAATRLAKDAIASSTLADFNGASGIVAFDSRDSAALSLSPFRIE